MSSKTKSQLRTENNSSFPNNNSQLITPEILRTFNEDIIDSMVSNEDSGSFTVDSGSLLTTASFDNGTRDMTFTKGDGSTFTTNIPGVATDTGSLLVTASNDFSEITFTKGDGTTFLIDGTPRQVIETVKNKNGFMAKGTPVYVSGSTGNELHVYAASASRADRMPATFVLEQDLNFDESGTGILAGFINGVDTSAFGEGDEVYVGVNGGYTNVKPTGSANFIQKLGNVVKSDLNGSGVISGAGRSNDLPNITQGYTWVGDSNGVPQPIATSSFGGGGGSAFPFTGSAEISGSLTVTNQIQTTDTNATATYLSSGAGNGYNQINLVQSALNSNFTVNQNAGDGGQQLLLNKSGAGLVQLNLNGTSGDGYVQAQNGLTQGQFYGGSDYAQVINQSGSVDRRLIFGGASRTIPGVSLTGDVPYIAIRSNTGIQEVLQFQHPGNYSDGTISALTPISSSSDIISNTLFTNQLTASLQEGYVFVGNVSNKNTQISTSSLQTSIPSGTVSGSSQLTSSYDTRYAQLDGTNFFSGPNNIFTGSVLVSGSGQFINPVPGGFQFNEAISYGSVNKNNVPYGYGLNFAGMLNYSGASNRYDNALVMLQANSAAFNYFGITYNAGYEMGNIMQTISGSLGTNRLETNADGTTTFRAYGTDVQIGTSNNNSITIGNAGITQGVTIGAATQIQLGGGSLVINAPTTASGDISSSADLYGNNATIAGTLNLGNTIISGSVKTETAIQSISSLTASIDFSDTSMFELTLADSVDTHIDATNIGQGQTINVLINQAATTPGTVSFSPKFYFPSGSSYTATATAGARDILTLITFTNENNVYVSSVNNMVQ